MNEVCRARVTSSSQVNFASLVKIWRSGQNRIRVPVTPFLTRRPLCSPEPGSKPADGPSPPKTPGNAALEGHRLGGRRAVDLDVEPRRERVHDRGADAVQATGRGVGATAELAARVQLGEDHLDAREPGLGLLVDRDPASVVVHLGGPVGVQRHVDPGAVAGQRLVHRVVDDLPEAVHEPARVRRADVHARPLADRLQPLEHEQVLGVVRVVDGSTSAVGAPRQVR